MQFAVLGPLEVAGPGGVVAVGGPKERALLVALVLRANAVVPTTQLMTDLWGDDPPRSAPKTIQTYVSHVRRALPDVAIETVGAGYRLTVDLDCIDAVRFERLAAAGHAALESGDHAGAIRSLTDAFALWRGDPLAEFDDAAFAAGEATRLNELRLGAIEDRVEAGLAQGEARQLVGELQRLVRAHPLRERLWGQLMLALYRSGRQADALAVYQQARRHLVEEAGVEPGEELRALERALLEQDPALGGAPITQPAPQATITVTVVLTDIEGSTRLWELDAGRMATTVAELERTIASTVAEHHGTLVKSKGEGDSTFSVFGRASDALRAAVAFQRANADRRGPGDEPVRVRVALHTGEVEHRDGDYFGRAVNRAARLRSLGTGGTILLSGPTAGLVADDLPEGGTLVDLGRHALRDLARPEQVFAVEHPELAPPPDLARRATASFPTALLAACERPLVGRKQELDRLRSAWQRARAGSLGLCFVSGEPGAGKTRLAAELAREAVADGGQVLLGRCDEEALTPYQPFVEALDQLGAGALWTSTGGDGYALFNAIAAAIADAADRAPLVFVIDDLHWADRSTLALLRHVVRARAGAAVLILATYRDTEVGRDRPLAAELAEVVRDAHVDRVTVRGLDRAGVANLLSQFGAPSELAGRVHESTNGNAFFVTEVARQVGVDGPGAVDVPEGVKEAIGRRLTRLSPDTNRLLSAGSVSGRQFTLPVVAEVAGIGDDAALDAVEAAVTAGLVRDLGPDVYEFSHALVRDTLYGELSGSRRTRFHRVTAEVIESRNVGDLGPVAAGLAYHFAESGEHAAHGPTARYSMLAADHAETRFAFAEEADHLRRALELADAAGDERRGAAVRIRLGAVLMVAGEPATAKDQLRAAVAVARRIDDAGLLAEAANAFGAWFDETPLVAQELLELTREALTRIGPDAPITKAKLRSNEGAWLAMVEPGPGVAAVAQDAVTLARTTGDAGALSWALGQARVILGPDTVDPVEFADVSRRAGGTGYPGGELFALHWAASCHIYEGDIAGARSYVDVLAARTPPDSALSAWAPTFYAVLACLGGRFREARHGAHLVEAAYATAGVARPWMFAGSIRYQAAVFEGRLAEALPILGQLHALHGAPVVGVREMRAYALAETGDHDGAADILDALVEEDFDSIRHEFWRQQCLALAARAAAAIGHDRAAGRLYEILRPHSGRVVNLFGSLACVEAVDHDLGILATTLGRFDQAVTHLDAALELHRGNEWHALVAETEFELGRALAGRDRRGDRRRALDLMRSAAAAAEELGMRSLAARTSDWVETLARPPLPARLRTVASAPFVGRDSEWRALRSAWADAAGGDGPLVLISGEAGIGKSRLAGELARHAHAASDAHVLYGGCVDGLAGAYQPIGDALRETLNWIDLDALERHCRAYGGELARLVPSITERIPDLPAPMRLEPDVERLRHFDAVAGMVATLASGRPVLLLIDDLQWASAPTLQMISHTVRQIRGLPVLVAGTFREEIAAGSPLAAFLADVQREAGVVRLSLSGLDHDAVAQLVGPAEHDAGDLLSQTGGNPFFLGELVRHLAAGGSPAHLPVSVAEVLGFRLDRLDAAANRLLAVAATAGEQVGRGVLAAAFEGDVLDPLDACLAARLLVEIPGGVAFPHALVRRAVLSRVSAARAEALHAAVAAAIADVHGDDAHAAALAGHWAAAGPAHAVDAASAALRGAAYAQARLASEEALALAELGLDALGDGPADALRADLHLARAAAYDAIGDVPALRDAAWAAANIGRELASPVGAARMARAVVAMTTHIALGGLNEAEETLTRDALASLAPTEPVFGPDSSPTWRSTAPCRARIPRPSDWSRKRSPRPASAVTRTRSCGPWGGARCSSPGAGAPTSWSGSGGRSSRSAPVWATGCSCSPRSNGATSAERKRASSACARSARNTTAGTTSATPHKPLGCSPRFAVTSPRPKRRRPRCSPTAVVTRTGWPPASARRSSPVGSRAVSTTRSRCWRSSGSSSRRTPLRRWPPSCGAIGAAPGTTRTQPRSWRGSPSPTSPPFAETFSGRRLSARWGRPRRDSATRPPVP